MLKCVLCFVENLPRTKKTTEEEQRIAMAQSRTAETILHGNALCAEHASQVTT